MFLLRFQFGFAKVNSQRLYLKKRNVKKVLKMVRIVDFELRITGNTFTQIIPKSGAFLVVAGFLFCNCFLRKYFIYCLFIYIICYKCS